MINKTCYFNKGIPQIINSYDYEQLSEEQKSEYEKINGNIEYVDYGSMNPDHFKELLFSSDYYQLTEEQKSEYEIRNGNDESIDYHLMNPLDFKEFLKVKTPVYSEIFKKNTAHVKEKKNFLFFCINGIKYICEYKFVIPNQDIASNQIGNSLLSH